MPVREALLNHELDHEHRETEVKEIAVIPASSHGHMSNFYSSIWIVYENGDKRILMSSIPNSEAGYYAKNLREELERIKQEAKRHEQI